MMDMTVAQLSKLLENKELSAREVCERYAAREDKIGAFLHRSTSYALEVADKVDARRARGEKLSPLAGVPIAVKDNICTAKMPTTCASKTLDGFVPPYNATVIEKTEAAGMPVLGKTNMDEFAMGSRGEHSAFFRTENPHRSGCVPGGSSSGSAAAVAGGLAPIALGSDTGGSVRLPAAYCGLVGFKPSYGAISRFGLIAYASSLDQIGILSKDVCDTELLFDAISGHDARDMTSMNLEKKAFSQPKIGFLKDCALEIDGENAEFPLLSELLPIYYILSSAEAASNLARYDGIRYGKDSEFGAEVQRRIKLGNFVLSSERVGQYYERALRARALVIAEVERLFERFDILALPTVPSPAPRFDEERTACEDYALDAYTVLANLTYLPAISLPIGDLGVTLMAKRGADYALLCVAKEVLRNGI